ncbi:chromatin licensing and DNA replication factor double parked [Haematobia irritans]|uniref:chromatin licensing and DNA replication factor double parked n=1 Tax=Haematobia irritans TaxID=7368 RepID=UPI003F4FA831
MAQPSIAAFFNTRKRAVAEDVTTIKNRRLLDSSEPTNRQEANANTPLQPNDGQQPLPPSQQDQHDEIAALKKMGMRTRSGRTVVKRIGVQDPSQVPDSGVSPKKISKIEENVKQQKLVEFIKKGTLSPRKKPAAAKSKSRQKINESTPTATIITAFTSQNNAKNVERGLKTPTKQIIKGSNTPLKQGELKSMVKKELTFDEVKTKVSRSAKLQELKASLARIQELEKTRKAQEERNRLLKESLQSPSKKTPVLQLKEFDKIELEVLTSPSKTFKTPTKLPPPTPDKNELMSPRHTDVSKRVLFSPAKLGSPSKMVVPPAYQRFMSLAESSKAGQLAMPYKYRHLVEIFKGLDSVCAMFHNRREVITFKKLKPAVQRMLRKNFYERHLAQIKHLYPDAFIFSQMKMRNYGSASKADYFQLVIAPNVENLPEKMKMNKIDEDDVLSSAQSNSMNPHVMTERLQKFQFLLLQKVKEEHEKFLKSLDPPLSIPKEKVTRWHPDFDLENCPEIPLGNIPQPPNVEKYSSAKDILSTARNLFNCATPMERVMERYEAKIEADKVKAENQKNLDNTKAETSKEPESTKTAKENVGEKQVEKDINAIAAPESTATPTTSTPAADATSNLLKGVPKSLLEKIRAKQAAKALDAMTRRPSQDQEAAKYSRLPEMARHLRNVFITERKGVLTQEIVIKKIQNSFRTSLTAQDIENHLKLMAKEVPAWVAFHEVRKTMYLKINKEMDLSKVIERLETVANEKSKM